MMNLVDQQIEAYNQRNLKAFLDCYSDKIEVYLLESNQCITKGKDQLGKIIGQSFKTNPNSSTEVISRIYQNNLIVNQEKITGHDGDKIITTISIYEVVDNQITKLWFGGRKSD